MPLLLCSYLPIIHHQYKGKTMNSIELERVIRLGLRTVGEVGRYLQLIKNNHNELEVLYSIRFVNKY